MARRKIAVVGSGIGGLTAAYVLQRAADVTLFEADHRLGGHAHTHDVDDPSGRALAVDSGFIVHNARTYPHLRRLFAELDVSTQESDMSMSISCGGCGLQYAGGRGLSGLFPTLRTSTRPRYLTMLVEVRRFHARAAAVLTAGDDRQTLGEFVRSGRFSSYFTAHFLTPLISAVWSTAPSRAMEYPARYLFAFLDNHGMLSVHGTPQWLTVVGGSARYVEKAAKNLSAVQTSTPVRALYRVSQGVAVRDDADAVSYFDGAVVATHPDQALALLAEPTADERDVLGAITYSRNPTLLHTDASVLPAAPRAQASWNYYLPSCATSAASVHVSYNMNRLQHLETATPYVVTLNDDGRVDPGKVLARMVYDHPLFTGESVAAVRRLPALNDGVLAYAGAYHGWGFHEDGCRSGMEAARSLGVPWS